MSYVALSQGILFFRTMGFQTFFISKMSAIYQRRRKLFEHYNHVLQIDGSMFFKVTHTLKAVSLCDLQTDDRNVTQR